MLFQESIVDGKKERLNTSRLHLNWPRICLCACLVLREIVGRGKICVKYSGADLFTI